ncbi:hypothetical protein CsSME_00028726 [Camellia sinensis var. sinensis]
MMEIWRYREHCLAISIVLVCLMRQNLNLCWSLNDEGMSFLFCIDFQISNWSDDIGVLNPCSWFGVECLDSNVVVLNLKDLCLTGTLTPDLGILVHLKSIILRNNSFYGIVPEMIGELKELEMLDLGHNNFSGPLPSDLGNNLSLSILFLEAYPLKFMSSKCFLKFK